MLTRYLTNYTIKAPYQISFSSVELIFFIVNQKYFAFYKQKVCGYSTQNKLMGRQSWVAQQKQANKVYIPECSVDLESLK